MTFKPILFNTPMVQALVEGSKTQTRRVIKTQPGEQHTHIKKAMVLDNSKRICFNYHSGNSAIVEAQFPKYQPGDILWVRETWQLFGWNFDEGEVRLKYKDGSVKTFDDFPHDIDEWLARKIDKLEDRGILKIDPEDEERMELAPGKDFPWEPSIFMPKWACRNFLEVTNVRVERLNDISDEDAIAEGVSLTPGLSKLPRAIQAQTNFQNLWKSINGKDSWEANPWVFVYTFNRVFKPESFL